MFRFLPVPLVLAMALSALPHPAAAISEGEPAGADLARSVVMLSSDRGSFCSATVIAPDLLLTAGHCVGAKASYRMLTFNNGQPVLSPLGKVVVHPSYDSRGYSQRRRTIDLALVRLPQPLRGMSALPLRGEAGQPDAAYRVAGFGLTQAGNGRTGGVLREAAMRGAPPVSSVQLRLAPAQGRAAACQGDSGGPVLRGGAVVGVLASTARTKGGCSGMSGVALIATALPWIRTTARQLGSPID